MYPRPSLYYASLPPWCTGFRRYPFPVLVVVACRHLPCLRPLSRQSLLIPLPFFRLATFARTPAKNHSVVHSQHAKNVFPALTSSLVTRGYTVTITARPLPAVPVKRTRRLYPLLMAGMMRMQLSPGESRKRRLGAEQTATMRCV
jgi:hypothetical protein